jgi:hypothetical protein
MDEENSRNFYLLPEKQSDIIVHTYKFKLMTLPIKVDVFVNNLKQLSIYLVKMVTNNFISLLCTD